MRKLWIIGLITCLQASACFADTSLLIFGASQHYGCSTKCDYKEFNPGLGVEFSWPTEESGRPFVRLGGYRDSSGDAAGFVSGGMREDWPLAGSWRGGLGLLGGYQFSDHQGVVVMPFVYVASGSLAVEVGFIPFTNLDGRNHKAKRIAILNLRWDL